MVMVGVATTTAHSSAPSPIQGSCPGLVVLGVQGTSESSPTADPFIDSGMLGQVFGPAIAQGVSIQRAYVPYPASFGGAALTGAGILPFADSVAAGRANLDSMATAAVDQCPNALLAVAGFSGGAAVVSDFATQVGAGSGPVPADRIAGVALISNPTRRAAGGPFPGRPGQSTPSPAPGTAGSAVGGVHLPPVPPSGGIADTGVDFGALNGRVGEFCAPGDLSCDAPAGAALLRTAAGIAAQSVLLDPIAAVASLGGALAGTAGRARVAVVLNDVHVRLGQVSYEPTRSISQRLADAADPRYPSPDPGQVAAAAVKEGQVLSALAADPASQIPRLLTQVGASIPANLADNAAMIDPATWGYYGNIVANHVGYAHRGQTRLIADWFAALSRDLAGHQ
ncbi:cutinase family protein [Nocardia sp. NPDC003963]